MQLLRLHTFFNPSLPPLPQSPAVSHPIIDT